MTLRETEILYLILKETSTVEIAKKLNISNRTVDAHRINIMKKAETSSLIGLFKYAIKNKLVEI